MKDDWPIETRNIIVLWVTAIIGFVLFPYFVYSKCSLRRIFQRRDNPQANRNNQQRNEQQTDAEVTQGVESQQSQQDTHIWEQKQVVLLKRLSQYTLELSKNNFICCAEDNKNPAQPSITTGGEINKVVEDNEKSDDESVSSLQFPRTVISLHHPGESSNNTNKTREASSMCAICLCSYMTGDRVSWSSNKKCFHVFHEECIIQWLFALLEKQRRGALRSNERPQQPQQQSPRNGTLDYVMNFIRASPREESGSNEGTTDVESGSNGNAWENEMVQSMMRECPCCRQEFIVSEEPKCDDSSSNENDNIDDVTIASDAEEVALDDGIDSR